MAPITPPVRLLGVRGETRPALGRHGLLGLVGTSFALGACATPTADLQISHAEGEGDQSVEPVAEAKPTARKSSRSKKGDKPATAKAGRPRVVEATLLTGDHLQLQFSEAMAPTDGVDANDFRISLGMAYAYPGYAYAYLYDPGYAMADKPSEFTSVRSDGDMVHLYLDPPFDMSYCWELAQMVAEAKAEPGVTAEGGIYLHYAAGDVPVTDTQGKALADVGADWVIARTQGGDYSMEKEFEGPAARTALRGLIPINCGEKVPPGPT